MTATRGDLPEAVQALALRCGARPDGSVSAVVMSQHGFMKDRPADRPMMFSADETIQLDRTEFRWVAKCDPINLLVVRDQLIGSEGKLSLLAFGALPISTVSSGAKTTKGDIIRYLAELPWAPDAILRNHELTWQALDQRTFLVSAGGRNVRGEVVLRLGDDGLVSNVEAEDRPRKENGHFVERPWRGRFTAYEQRQGRLVPSRGEVGWMLDGAFFEAWFGELKEWRLQ